MKLAWIKVIIITIILIIKENYTAYFWTFAMVIQPLYSHWTLCPHWAALTGKLPQNRNKQGNETELAGLTVTRDGDDLRRHLLSLP